MFDVFQLPFVQRGLLELVLLSVGAGLIGPWIVLRGLAFFSHAVGTATFPGLVLAGGLGFAAPIGAMIAALVYAVGLGGLARPRRSGYDSATALALAGALAAGVILASDVFDSGSSVDSLLFGSLLLIEPGDLVLAGAASVAVAALGIGLGRAWMAAGFDRDAARALGLRTTVHDAALLVLIALLVVAMLSALGALLATALLIVPAATVRLWTRTLAGWQLATIGLIVLEGTTGIWLSVETDAPPGATVALVAGAIFALSALARSVAARAPVAAAPAAAATALLACLCLVGAGCASDDVDDGRVEVVATTTEIADWARTVGDGQAKVTQLLQPNTDPHDYEPRPSDVRAAADADLVFTNGDGLDDWIDKVVEQSGGDPRVVDLGAAVAGGLPDQGGGTHSSERDPHWSHDPRNAAIAVEEIRDALVSAAPPQRGAFESTARDYLAELRELDRAIADCIGQVPRGQRKLVTDHDAFGYFAKRYGIEVVGAVIPSQTTQSRPSAGDVTDLSETIRAQNVRAIFPESSLNAKLAKAIARQTGASADHTLYGDALGPPGSDGDTYVRMLASNARSMVEGFSDRRQTCEVARR